MTFLPGFKNQENVMTFVQETNHADKMDEAADSSKATPRSRPCVTPSAWVGQTSCWLLTQGMRDVTQGHLQMRSHGTATCWRPPPALLACLMTKLPCWGGPQDNRQGPTARQPTSALRKESLPILAFR